MTPSKKKNYRPICWRGGMTHDSCGPPQFICMDVMASRLQFDHLINDLLLACGFTTQSHQSNQMPNTQSLPSPHITLLSPSTFALFSISSIFFSCCLLYLKTLSYSRLLKSPIMKTLQKWFRPSFKKFYQF